MAGNRMNRKLGYNKLLLLDVLKCLVFCNPKNLGSILIQKFSIKITCSRLPMGYTLARWLSSSFIPNSFQIIIMQQTISAITVRRFKGSILTLNCHFQCRHNVLYWNNVQGIPNFFYLELFVNASKMNGSFLCQVFLRRRLKSRTRK